MTRPDNIRSRRRWIAQIQIVQVVWRDRAKEGFTLIEVLASIIILMLITVFVGRLFVDASRLWQLGTRRVYNAQDGRAVIDFMVREISMAIADDVLVFAHRVDATNVLGLASDHLYFVTCDNTARRVTTNDVKRQVKQISYIVAQMRDGNNQPIPGRWCLLRNIRNNATSGDFQCYTNRLWWRTPAMNQSATPSGDSQVLAENIRTIEYWVYKSDGKLLAGQDYQSDVHGPPGWLEIYLELMSEQDAIRASLLPNNSQEQEDFCDRVSRRYVGRVYFPHARGYAPTP